MKHDYFSLKISTNQILVFFQLKPMKSEYPRLFCTGANTRVFPFVKLTIRTDNNFCNNFHNKECKYRLKLNFYGEIVINISRVHAMFRILAFVRTCPLVRNIRVLGAH